MCTSHIERGSWLMSQHFTSGTINMLMHICNNFTSRWCSHYHDSCRSLIFTGLESWSSQQRGSVNPGNRLFLGGEVQRPSAGTRQRPQSRQDPAAEHLPEPKARGWNLPERALAVTKSSLLLFRCNVWQQGCALGSALTERPGGYAGILFSREQY